MKSSVMLAKDDPQLSEFLKELTGIGERMDQRIKFAIKIVEDAAKSCQEENTAVWDKIQARLIELGKIPSDYSKDKDCLSLNKKTGLIEIEPHAEHFENEKKSMLGKALLGGLLNSLTNPSGPTVH